MPKGYWIAHNEVHDPETYKKYLAGCGVAFEKYGAKFLVRGGKFTLLEGNTRSRQIVIEFPTYQAALDCYHSPEYQNFCGFRQASSVGDTIVMEGVE